MTEVNDVPIGHAAIDGRVLAHWRDDNAVRQLEGTDAKRSEQHAHADFSLFTLPPPGRCQLISLSSQARFTVVLAQPSKACRRAARPYAGHLAEIVWPKWLGEEPASEQE